VERYASAVVRAGLSFGESPRWHGGRLWYSDFYRHGVFSMTPDGREEHLEHSVAGQPSGLGWTDSGELLCVSMTDHRVLRAGPGGLAPFCDVTEYCGYWANDLAVGSSGHAYVGNFGFDLDTLLAERGPKALADAPSTNLVVIDPRGVVAQVVAELAFPNGMVITPDGATLVVAETMASRLSAFDLSADGTLANRRVWARLRSASPDGICLDAGGQIWVANAVTNQCLRVAEGGEVSAVLTTTQRAYACMLGGEDRRTLYVMTSPDSSRFVVAGTNLATIEAVRVATPGAGRP
jgi:sugar lactone lactonase YvrE